MKPISITLLFIFLPILLSARGPGSGPNGGQMGHRGAMQGTMAVESSPEGSPQGMSTLYQFLSLDDDALEQLEATIHRIRQMTPEERITFQKKILEYQEMPTEERQHIQRAWGQLDSAVRSAWRNYMMSLDPEERDRVRKELHTTPPDSRTKWRIEVLKEAGLLEEDAAEDVP